MATDRLTMRIALCMVLGCCISLQILLWKRAAGFEALRGSDLAQEASKKGPLPTPPRSMHTTEQQATTPTTTTAAAQTYFSFPDKCTPEQLTMIEYQLPAARCKKTANNPWQNRCSFSYATQCPTAVWMQDFYHEKLLQQQKQQHRTTISRKEGPPTAIYIGCNKGMDAVNTLRMLSSDKTFDKDKWRERLFANQTAVAPGKCNQEFEPQYEPNTTFNSSSSNNNNSDAVVHCIEALPINARRLKETVDELQWQSSLKVVNAAMAATDGTALFPNDSDQTMGVESIGIQDCTRTGRKRFCKTIPQYKLDTYVDQHVSPSTTAIDFLSIDVEGFDWQVLLGATRTLERVNYLEFEYNWRGAWKDQTLSGAIQELKNRGFLCYWAGTAGNIWRITDCWMDYYDLHFWSNVACVNTRRPAVKPMADRMEELFLETLAAGRTIRYHNASSANTDGKLAWDLPF